MTTLDSSDNGYVSSCGLITTGFYFTHATNVTELSHLLLPKNCSRNSEYDALLWG